MITEIPNLNKIKHIAADSKDFEYELIAILKEELPLEINQYYLHLKTQDFIKCAADVHKLKHKISILNMHMSYEFAIIYEDELKLGDNKSSLHFDKILNAMSTFISKI